MSSNSSKNLQAKNKALLNSIGNSKSMNTITPQNPDNLPHQLTQDQVNIEIEDQQQHHNLEIPGPIDN